MTIYTYKRNNFLTGMNAKNRKKKPERRDSKVPANRFTLFLD